MPTSQLSAISLVDITCIFEFLKHLHHLFIHFKIRILCKFELEISKMMLSTYLPLIINQL